MSIKTFWSNLRPMSLIGMADSQATVSVSGLIDEQGWEVCACDGCDFVETQYVKNGGTLRQNDRKSFIRARILNTDTITFQLYRDGLLKATLNSNSYGDYYDFGSLTIGAYKGIIIDWNLVQQAFGYGHYTVRTTHVSAGQTYTFDSHKFNVIEYTPERADGSVKIETYQNGSILSGFDYTGIGWYQSLRINGRFGNKTPKFEQDTYQDTLRNVKQISAEIENSFELTTHLLPGYISDYLNEDAVLSNIIFITDYNLLNQHLYNKFPVYLSNITSVTNHNFSKKSNYTYELKKVEKNIIKRNVEGDVGLLPIPQSAVTKYIEVKTLVLKFDFLANESETSTVTIDADSAGTFSATSQDGSSGTITWSLNGGAFGAFPATLEVGDTLKVKRTSSISAGWTKLTGLYE